ncbi:YggS family pyridoxal phosphate-dependent enzyme [Allobranchiibius sp. CTAmp26]|uniref:YggS family pyridoxal phosphate-dependent enzyme n=1 Tax=Allobranchiibius sp. CTAmp26 TaxID=2815214 RepID=UPI001AA148BD|nr:YggS family pyridoxal phosphate-dependent enzyme [Allobranchiibius sp. CTAmp26]MBO1755262.1 YggS family pyridoxal phosphate-dependent enzyme [Allobranchiibius sp. CTAmp26]
MSADPRGDELAQNLAGVQDHIDRACAEAGRGRDELTLIVVTKFFPVDDVRRLHDLGVRDIGESRDQEAAAKVADLDPAVRADLRVHFIGQLQSNKAPHVSAYADVVHSVDRAKIVGALDRGAMAQERTLQALVQVDLSGDDAGRGGAVPEQVAELADLIASSQALQLRGVMAVAPLDGDAGEAFARLSEIAAGVRANHPDATWISAGMSGDLESAVAAGATHLRVGSAILGSRPPRR